MAVSFILEERINKLIQATDCPLGEVVLITLPTKSNNFLIKERNNIQGVISPVNQPDRFFNFVIHVDDEGNADTFTIMERSS